MIGTEGTVLGLAALWQVVQIGLAGASMNRDMGPRWNAGPRDDAPQFSARTGRLRRAVTNHFEALALFTIAVVLVWRAEAASSLTAGAAWLYLVARVLYVPAYAFGWTPWRSLIWTLGFLATLAMIVHALLT